MLSFVRARVLALSLLVVAAMFLVVTESRPLGAGAFIYGLLALVIGPSVETDAQGQFVASFIALAAGVLAPRMAAVEHPTGVFLSDRTLLAATPAILVATTRAFFARPTGGAPLTIAVALVALAGAGRAPSPYYVWAVGAFVVLAPLAIGLADAGRAWPRDGSARHVATIALAAALAGSSAWAIVRVIPMIHDGIVRRIMERTRVRSGFSSGLALDDLEGMYESDRVVLRVRNGSPKLLRGAVFSHYTSGFWSDPTNDANRIARATPQTPADASYTEVEYPRRPERYFLPSTARDVRASTGSLLESPDGIASPTDTGWAKRLYYVDGPRLDHPAPIADDFAVPPGLRTPLEKLAASWARGSTPEEKLATMEAALQENDAYSLTFERTPGVEPVTDFLFVHRRGHCEYFASSFALLSRAIGIPARVVTGFRVVERSPLGGYSIVRDRHAHAWVEVWLDRRWVTFDPTPSTSDASLAGATRTPFSTALGDLLSTSWEKVDDFLAARTPFELSLALVGLVGLLLLVRLGRGRGPRGAPIAAPVERPLPCFEALEVALAEKGAARARHETLDTFADRLDRADAGEPFVAATRAIRRYAHLRYGGVGDEPDVVRDLERATRDLKSPAVAPIART